MKKKVLDYHLSLLNYSLVSCQINHSLCIRVSAWYDFFNQMYYSKRIVGYNKIYKNKNAS